MQVDSGHLMYSHWPYYMVKVCGGRHDNRWLHPLRGNTAQWADDNGTSCLHLYFGTLPYIPGELRDLHQTWWLIETWSPSRNPSEPGPPCTVLAQHPSFFEDSGEVQRWQPCEDVEECDRIYYTQRLHENEYAKIKEAQDLELLESRVKEAVIVRASASALAQAKAEAEASWRKMEAYLQKMQASFNTESQQVQEKLSKQSEINVSFTKNHTEVKSEVRELEKKVEALNERQAVMEEELSVLRRKRSRSPRRETGRGHAAQRLRRLDRDDRLSVGDVVYIRDRRGNFSKRFFNSKRGDLYNLTVDECRKEKHRGLVYEQQLYLKKFHASCCRD